VSTSVVAKSAGYNAQGDCSFSLAILEEKGGSTRELGTDLITPRGTAMISDFQSMFGNDLHCLSLLAFAPTPPAGRTEYITS
jgi:hypothetical protein